MPLYDYRCEACQHEWEDSYKMDEREKPTKKPCPKCKKKKVILRTTCTGLVDPFVLGRRKPTTAFKEVMSNIKKTGGRRVKKNLSGAFE